MSVIYVGGRKHIELADERVMAKIEHLDQKRRDDKLAAHLALGAEGGPVSGECLTPEELADVATNVCSREAREKALAHFSSCQKCYDAWVAISFSIAAVERGPQRRRRALGSARNLAFLGSAFAIAASVVVFLNIREVPLETQMTSPPAEYREESVSEAPAKRVESESRLKSLKLRDDFSTSPPAAPAQLQKRQAPAAEAEEEVTAGGALFQADVAESVDQSISVHQWLSEVEAVCRAGGDRSEALGELAVKGRGMTHSSEEAVLVNQVLALLEAHSGTTRDDQCPRILELLAKNGEWE